MRPHERESGADIPLRWEPSFATHLTHVLNRGPAGVRSPADQMFL